MSVGEKAALVALVRSSSLPRRQVLAQLGLPKTTYYRWSRRREAARSLEDKKPGARVPWNKLRPDNEEPQQVSLRFGSDIVFGDPDGIRTHDLQLDKLAC